MGRLTVVAGTIFVAATTAWAVACVGDDPSTTAVGAGDGGASETGVGPDGGTCRGDEVTACGSACTKCPDVPGGKATCTAGACGAECAAPAVACSAECPVLAASADHCGACGHSCGGGVCLEGKCQPVAVAQGLVGAVAFAVAPTAVVISMTSILASCDLPAGCGNAAPKELAKGYKYMGPVAVSDGEIFWSAGSQGDSESSFVRRCPLAGCPPVAVQIDTSPDTPIPHLDVRGTSLIWWRTAGGGQIRSCTLPTCTAPLTVIKETDLLDLITDGTSIFFSREVTGNPSQLFKCAANAACVTPPVFTTGRVGGPKIRERGGILYGVDPGETAGINDGYVWTAPAGAAGATKPFAREEVGPTDLAVDADGVFWINPTLKTVSMCPVTGCVGAPTVLAQQQTGLKAIATDAKFVYWLTDIAVFKVAK